MPRCPYFVVINISGKSCWQMFHAMLPDVETMRIAIDTNVLIAALTRLDGTSARIVQGWLDRRLEVVASNATIREAELVLSGGWLARMVERERIELLLEALRTRTVMVEKPSQIRGLRLKDPGDLRLVEAAVAAGARYIVTTDREFLRARGWADVEFVTPSEFWEGLDKAEVT